ncbi:hypothetical protein ACHQM5_022729 [Ranunculus cassubicifolius]
MGYSKEQLLTRLQELQINFNRYDHPIVMTVEAQKQYIGHLSGGISKNLFLKDKKNRFYVVSALSGTQVELKGLSQRLGLGKGGLRMAPEEALQEILQVPLGSVTPFALFNDSARNVSLLLDQGFKAQECCYFHPLSNDVTISLKASDLDRFLISIGKTPSYVDFEAEPSVGKDQPPDLASLVPSGAISLPEATSNHVPLPNTPEVVTEKLSKLQVSAPKPAKQQNNSQAVKEKVQSSVQMNVIRIQDQILDKISSVVLSQITSESIQQHGEKLGGAVADGIKKNLSADLESILVSILYPFLSPLLLIYNWSKLYQVES